MADIDVSIILTLHCEAKYVHRTLTALRDAAAFARQQSIRVELVAVLDRADPATQQAFHAANRSGFDAQRVIAVDNGSLGVSRNDGCRVASGKYLVMCDGDDLIGYSFFGHAFAAAELADPHTLFVPKFTFGFGARYFTVEYVNLHDIYACASVRHPVYSACAFGRRSLFAENPYDDVRLSPGYAYEDWHFNCNAIARNWHFVAVEGTALFYRQRIGSLLNQAELMSTRQIPRSRLFEPLTFVRMFASEVEKLQGSVRRPVPPVRGAKVFEEPVYRDLIRRANAIDPAVDLGCYTFDCMGHFSNLSDASAGVAYYHACEIVGTSEFEAVFFFPVGDSPDPLAQEIEAYAASHPQARILVLRDGPELKEEDDPILPASAIVIDLALLSPLLSPSDRDVIALKLLQSCAASACLFCGTSEFARRFFCRFGVLLRDWHVTCFRPTDRYDGAGGFAFVDPGPFEFISDHLDVIDRIVWYEEATMKRDWLRMPEMRNKAELRASLPEPAA